MPKITIVVNEQEMKLLRRIARHERRDLGTISYLLMHKGLEQIRQDERVGMHFYGPAPRLPALAAPIGFKDEQPRFRNKTERDIWILTGIAPSNEGIRARAQYPGQETSIRSFA